MDRELIQFDTQPETLQDLRQKLDHIILKGLAEVLPPHPGWGGLYKRLFNIKIFSFFYVVFKIKPLGLLIYLMLLL